MNTLQIILVIIYSAMNVFALIYMGLDKARAVNDHRRIPEAKLLFLCICLCSLGVYVGMKVFRHKTRKLYFRVGVPLALLENVSLFYSVYIIFSK
jgi:uncharacterized membrane protein YsdA (DUF1294 family)